MPANLQSSHVRVPRGLTMSTVVELDTAGSYLVPQVEDVSRSTHVPARTIEALSSRAREPAMVSVALEYENAVSVGASPVDEAGVRPLFSLPTPRTQTLSNYLTDHDTIFLLDDSDSMRNGAWSEACATVLRFTENALDIDAASLELHFLNSFDYASLAVHGRADIRRVVFNAAPQGGTPIGTRVKENLDRRIDLLARSPQKPLYLVVITDCQISKFGDHPDHDLKKVLEDAAIRLQGDICRDQAIKVFFIPVGPNPGDDGIRVLRTINAGDLVSVIPHRGAGSLTADKLKEILLQGGR